MRTSLVNQAKPSPNQVTSEKVNSRPQKETANPLNSQILHRRESIHHPTNNYCLSGVPLKGPQIWIPIFEMRMRLNTLLGWIRIEISIPKAVLLAEIIRISSYRTLRIPIGDLQTSNSILITTVTVTAIASQASWAWGRKFKLNHHPHTLKLAAHLRRLFQAHVDMVVPIQFTA